MPCVISQLVNEDGTQKNLRDWTPKLFIKIGLATIVSIASKKKVSLKGVREERRLKDSGVLMVFVWMESSSRRGWSVQRQLFLRDFGLDATGRRRFIVPSRDFDLKYTLGAWPISPSMGVYAFHFRHHAASIFRPEAQSCITISHP